MKYREMNAIKKVGDLPLEPVYRILIVLLFLLPFWASGQQKPFQAPDSLPSHLELLKYDGISAFGGIKHSLTQPLRWEKEDYILAGSVALGTAALFAFDEETSQFFRKQEEDIPGVLKEIGHFGSPENMYALNGMIYLTGLITKKEKIRETGVLLLSSSTAAGILLALSKTVIGRARPYTNQGKGSFDPFSREESQHSFPSGHSLFAFTTAYAIGKQLENPYAKAGVYSLGLIGPVSRLWEGAHWLTDVTLSVVLGIAVVDSIDNYLKRERNYSNAHSKGIDWNLQIGLGRIGLSGSF